MTASDQFEYAVVGGGIAGLALAEIFARSGHKVALIEKHGTLCAETSSAHHGWFHFGSLYAIFPSNRFMRTMVGGIDDLLEYYSSFEGMNIVVERNGKLRFCDDKRAWIRDESIQYIVAARNNEDFDLRTFNGIRDYARKAFFVLTWDLTIKQFISRHQRFHRFDWRSGPASADVPCAGWFDYSREVISRIGDYDLALDPSTHFQVPGFDRPMRAMRIVRDLAHGFLSAGGSLLLDHEFSSYRKIGGEIVITTNRAELVSNQLVLASGSELKSQLTGRIDVSVLASPLLIAYPAVCDVNFVRLTPFMAQTINHIHHRIGHRRYSVIGGGYFADPGDERAMVEARERLEERAAAVFPRLREASLREVYFSHKTEMPTLRGERNYQYLIRPVEDRVHAIVPGKFSLGFSTAVNAYKRLVGREPRRDGCFSGNWGSLDGIIGDMRHERIVKAALGAKGDGDQAGNVGVVPAASALKGR